MVYRLALLEICYLYDLADNFFAKVFDSSMLSLLIVLQIRQNAKCKFLLPLLANLLNL